MHLKIDSNYLDDLMAEAKDIDRAIDVGKINNCDGFNQIVAVSSKLGQTLE